MKRTNLYSGSPWEKQVSYCRAVIVGDRVEIAGTVAHDESGPVHIGDPYKQALFILKRIKEALNEIGSDLSAVLRTRIYVTDITRWEEVGRAHQEVFEGIDPVTTLVEVSALINPSYLVEIEAEAILGNLGQAQELKIKH